MWEFLVVGTLWFWALTFIAVCYIVWALETWHPWRAWWVLVFSLALMYTFGHGNNWSLISYALDNPKEFMGWILVYLVIGIIWVFIKWGLFLLKLREQAREFEQYKDHPPQVRQYKSKIISWMSYWPFSMIGTFFGDIVRRIYNTIFEIIHDMLQSMSDHMFRKISKNVK